MMQYWNLLESVFYSCTLVFKRQKQKHDSYKYPIGRLFKDTQSHDAGFLCHALAKQLSGISIFGF